MRVKLKTKFGQFWDRRLRWGITAGEVKDLPEPLPQDTLTYQKLRMGGFQIIHDNASVAPDDPVAPASAPEYSETIQPEAILDVWDAPVIEVTDISVGGPDVVPSKEGIQDGSSIELMMTHGSPIESGRTTEPEAENKPAETPVPLDPKPAPKKRGRPKKTK